MNNDDKCVMCGRYIPEGRQICSLCEEKEPNFDTVQIKVLLDKITNINKFVQLVSKCKDDVMAKQSRWIVSAKSLMGMYCLNLSEPVTVEFYGDVPYEVQEGMKEFMVK